MWIWKIINGGVKVPNDFDLTYSIQKSKTTNIIIRKLKFPGKIYRKIVSIKSNRFFNLKGQELLNESMLHPKITVDANALRNYLVSKAVPLITDDESIARWCGHITTNGRTVESLRK